MTQSDVQSQVSVSGPDAGTPDTLQAFSGEPLLERSRAHWQMGDWASLAQLATLPLEEHVDRAKLSLLAAAGFAQLGDRSAMERCVTQARAWGCDTGLIHRVLVSGLINGLGRQAVLLDGNTDRASAFFEQSIAAVTPHADAKLLGRMRNVNESARLGLLPDAAKLLREDLNDVTENWEYPPQRAELFAASLDAIDAMLVSKGLGVDDATRTPAPMSDAARAALQQCVAADDLYTALETIEPELEQKDRCHLFIGLADHFGELNNRLTAIDCLASAVEHLPAQEPALRLAVARHLLGLDQPALAVECLLHDLLNDPALLDLSERKAIRGVLQDDSAEHGQHLLMARLSAAAHSAMASDAPARVLIEIGTTRERVPGQGSTEKLARFCLERGLHFITVDMDPHNSDMARRTFARMNVPFEAVTSKGEDYLADYSGAIDFIFLDAYDFDHGRHSELRQQRYEAFLGARIDEEQCHRMHLDCAKSLVTKLSPDGLICIDDTWQDVDGNWTAKGTTAVPYLLENGFELIEARNRAVLLGRRSTSG